MKFVPQSISDVILIKPNIKSDHRGHFIETFRQDLFEKNIGYEVNFIQENESQSFTGVLRGLHYQLQPYAQAKLVRVDSGSVLDVVVDIRAGSPNFGNYVVVELSEDNKYQLFVPRGFAHGFVVLSNIAKLCYKVDNYYAPKYERGIAFDDEQLGIDWRLSRKKLNLSKKDREYPKLRDVIDLFNYQKLKNNLISYSHFEQN